jgi:outer membrane lipoprotein SlyB
MKKLMVALMCLVLLAAAAMPLSAQTHRRHRHTSSRRAYYTYDSPRHRTFWQKHRDKLTTAAGAGGGALLGGLIGGKKGAGIGAIAGGGGSALYTYKLRKRHRRY